MAANIKVALGVDGAKAFQDAMKQSDAAVKALGSELKATTAEFGAAAKSEDGLKAQNEILSKTVTELGGKLNEQEKALDAVKQQFGEGSVEALKFQTDVNKTRTALAEAKNKIDANTKAIDDLGKEEDQTGKETTRFGDLLKANLTSEAIIGGVKALANAVVSVAKGLGDAAKEAAAFADDINTQSKVTGLSTNQLQKYAFAAEQVDVSVDTITGSLTKLTKNMNSAQSGSGAAAEAFTKLGISVTDESGALRDNEDVFNEAIRSLGNISNETERDALAMQIFGKSAQELNPLILGGADALEEYGKMAEEAGLILSEDSLNSLNGLQDALDTLKGTTQAAANVFMAQFAEPLTEVLNTVIGYVQRLTEAFQEGGFEAVLEEGGKIIDEVGDKIAEALPGIVQGITEFLVNAIPKLIELGTQLFVALIKGLPSAITTIVKNLPQLITAIVKALGEAIPEVLKVGVEIVKGLWDGIKSMVKWIKEKISGFVGGIVDGVKGVLGIHSPSKVFAGIGKNMALGIGEGFNSAMLGVEKTIGNAIPTSVDVGGGASPIYINLVNEIDGAVFATKLIPYTAQAQMLAGVSAIGG